MIEEKFSVRNQGPLECTDKQRYDVFVCVKLLWPSEFTKSTQNFKFDQVSNQKILNGKKWSSLVITLIYSPMYT